MNKKPEEIVYKKMWAVFAPDGSLQSRSLSPTKSVAMEMIAYREYHSDGTHVTWKDYKLAGFTIHKVRVTVTMENSDKEDKGSVATDAQ